MDETRNQPQSTDSGEKNGSPVEKQRLRLPDLPHYKLGQSSEQDAFHATDKEFVEFIMTLVPLEGDNIDHWTWEERRDFLNWAIDEAILRVQDGRLIPNEAALIEVVDGLEDGYWEAGAGARTSE